ncbi:hypothetical protein ABW19_dt0202196 [Dactylella cylindrospora]|nr:hypothetical protein ABW19_dt0202196 [Dactylella cylindrospora]
MAPKKARAKTTLDVIEPIAYDIYDDYIDPYYTEYVSPYVEQATPYVKIANEKYIQPAATFAIEQFDKHGRPELENIKAKALEGYTRVVEPHVKQLQAQAVVYYNDYLADLVATGHEIYVAYYPIVEKYAKEGYDFAIQQAHPYYIAALPYIEAAWKHGIETAGWVGLEGKGWVSRRWGMHVEPQIWRIQERLGLKGLNMKNATPVKEANPTPPQHTNPNASSSDTVSDTKIDEEPIKGDLSDDDAGAKEEKKEEKKKPSSEEAIAAARAIVEADIAEITAKFEEAGVKGVKEVVSKLDELCEKVLDEQNTPSEDLLNQLDDRIERQFIAFQKGLKDLVESPAEHQYVMMGFDNMVGTTFSNIESKKAEITRHTQGFLMDTYQNTAKIVDAALADMDSVLDIGMQELGMKWAWTDGITYKDWAQYHELKKTFGNIKTKVIRAGQGHKKLREVTDYAKSIDDAAEDIVKAAHVEIDALEKAGREKLEALAQEPAVEEQEVVPAPEANTEEPSADAEEPGTAGDVPAAESQTEPEVAAEEELVSSETPAESDTPPVKNLRSDPRPMRPLDPEEIASRAPVEEVPKVDTEEPVVGTESVPEPEPESPKIEDAQASDTPVDETEGTEAGSKGSVVEENQTEAAPPVEEPSLKTERQSPKEDTGSEAIVDEKPIDEPKVDSPPREKIIEKDEL